ncbi:hypothetical protein ACIBI9_31605 [Nonomuraea sp. NPDC050451]|uniref:hypothetical protein n=1 Tax=Nonomuraea sp. NPDC050451 TaxID=3364364 RepID=UPI0037AC971F
MLARVLTRLLAVAGVTGLTLLGAAGPGWAHPFGPPLAAKVAAYGDTVEVTWSAADDDLSRLDQALAGRGQGVGDYLGRHIQVVQNGGACALKSVRAESIAASGAVLRFRCRAEVRAVILRITTLTDLDKAYRTVSTTPSGGGALHTAAAPAHVLRFGGASASDASLPPAGPAGIWAAELSSLVDTDVAFPLALLVALVTGAAHACAPGHGKTLTAGYLVGGNGRIRDAILLGGVVAAMHTVSVAVLAVGWWLAVDSVPSLGVVTRWLQLVASLVVVGVGLFLLVRHLHSHRATHGHGHGHGHGRGHGHGHGHGHVASLLTWRGIVTMGVSGGLLPSPSAFLLLLAGLVTGKALLALAMVAAFGVGMAATLAGAGILVLRGRDALMRATTSARLRAWTRSLPLAAAALVTAGGLTATLIAVVALTTS